MSHRDSPELLQLKTLVYYQKVDRETNDFLGKGQTKNDSPPRLY